MKQKERKTIMKTIEIEKLTEVEFILDDWAKIVKERYISNDATIPPLGLMSGKLGIAYLAAYYAEWKQQEEFLDFASTAIDKCIETISESEQNFDTFCDGVAGLAWVVQHFMQKGWLAKDEDTLLQFDDYLENVGLHFLQDGYYDYLHGGVGVALYWLERETGADYLKQVVYLLHKHAIEDSNGIYWINVDLGKFYQEQIVQKQINFSLSHGISSIIYLLTQIHARGIETELCEKMILGAIQFIRNHPCDPKEICSFPSSLNVDDEGNYSIGKPSRLAWCYGDLGMSVILLQAGMHLGNDDITSFAKEIALKTLKRKSLEASEVKDAGICHGIFGNALIYKKLFDYTNDNDFMEAYKHWFDLGKKYLKEENPLATYTFLNPQEKGNSPDSLLIGTTGIAFSVFELLNAPSKTKDVPHWDRIFLLS